MNRVLKSLLLLLVLVSWSCSKDTDTTVDFVFPTQVADICQIKTWNTPKFDRFSFEFFFESDRLSGMVMTSPSFNWPIRYTYRYTGKQLTSITQSLGETFPDYDSIVWQITYDNRALPVSEQATTYKGANTSVGGGLGKQYEYDAGQITVRDTGGPMSIYYLDSKGNIQRSERYNINGGLISFNEMEFGTNPSPFRNFPLVLLLNYSDFFDYSLINNVIKMRSTQVLDQITTENEYVYTYNTEGYPTEFRSTEENGSYSRVMEYSNCN